LSRRSRARLGHGQPWVICADICSSAAGSGPTNGWAVGAAALPNALNTAAIRMHE
jgi:hypothetical protein